MTDSSSSGEETASPKSGSGNGRENQEGSSRDVPTEAQPPRYHPPPQEEFDWRGWLLVGVVIVSFLLVPGAILYLPYAQDLIASVGIGWRQAYLALPMIPAILLGVAAIWVAVSSRRNSE